jgi:hypothetical protein
MRGSAVKWFNTWRQHVRTSSRTSLWRVRADRERGDRLSSADCCPPNAGRSSILVDQSTIYRWVQRFLPLFGAAARQYRQPVGLDWRVDETYARIRGRWHYIYRALDGTWVRDLPQELAPAFHELTTAMRNWENEIFAYFDYPITNAYTESLNNLMCLINRVGRGYSFSAIRAKLLYAETGRRRPKAGLLRFSLKGVTEATRVAADADYGADLCLLVKCLGRRPLSGGFNTG